MIPHFGVLPDKTVTFLDTMTLIIVYICEQLTSMDSDARKNDEEPQLNGENIRFRAKVISTISLVLKSTH